jgi:DNA-binding winged helix-turn-helix (wHTH) protein
MTLALSDLRTHCFPKSLRVLQRLIDAQGGLVTFRDLIDAAWPGDRAVNSLHLRQAINNIRTSLKGTGWTVSVVRNTGYKLERTA